ncbi:hypothetical protein AA313_de0210262 [Arthrobotrys entomopaga]|nr:hypothetical protein AA313_de0210262 [Arthrobotrys entomopaga]
MTAPGAAMRLPVELSNLPKYLADNKDQPVRELIKPFAQYEKTLRELFARDPSNVVLRQNLLGLVPVYAGQEESIEIRARDLDSESELEKSKYLIKLDEEERRKTGEKAIVGFEGFKRNFRIFTEGMFENMDWSNIIVTAGGVLVSMLPIPGEDKSSDRLREHYRNPWAPNQIEVFIYGLDQEAAIKRMKDIEATLRENVAWKVVCLRRTHSITMVSGDPYIPVRIVLGLYETVSQVLYSEKFNVDCACVAYDGKQVYATPQAVASWMLQCNDADPSRYSPHDTYEDQLYIYRKRGFEIYYPSIQRQAIDPSVYKFPVSQLHGLAKLINREMMYGEFGSKSTPEQDGYWGRSVELKGVYDEDKRLNAWGGEAQKDRVGYLHRHLIFFGTLAEVVEDCCGACPEPQSKEEEELRLSDDKLYIRGKLVLEKYKVDELSSQSHEAWTEMAYFGEDVTIYQAIVDEDVERVKLWATSASPQDEKHLKKLSRRDYTGRTPLQLASLASSPEIVEILINAGARISSRCIDGRTALHIAAARGNAEIVKLLLLKSDENEEIKEEKITKLLMANRRFKRKDSDEFEEIEAASEGSEDMDDIEVISDIYEGASVSVHTGAFSFMEVSKKIDKENEDPDDAVDTDDILDINMPDKCCQFTPLHYAIVNGHEEVVRLLVSDFGADILRPVDVEKAEFLQQRTPEFGYSRDKKTPPIILPMVLVKYIPEKKKREDMLRTILKLGATSGQTDSYGANALVWMVHGADVDCLRIIFEEDGATALAAAKEVMILAPSTSRYERGYLTCLMLAILEGDEEKALLLLEKGVPPTMKLETKKTEKPKIYYIDRRDDRDKDTYIQPAELAIHLKMLEVFKKCVDVGASFDGIDLNVLIPTIKIDVTRETSAGARKGSTYLNLILEKIAIMQRDLKIVNAALKYQSGTFERWVAARMVKLHDNQFPGYTPTIDTQADRLEERKERLERDINRYIDLGLWLVSKGGKTYTQLNGIAEHKEGLPPIKEALVRTDVSNRRFIYMMNCEDFRDFKDIVEGPDKKLKFNFGYSDSVHDEKMQSAYHDLFKAAWDGDFEKIKAYSLPSWDGDAAEPLKFAVQNRMGDTPYTIASEREHSYKLLDFIIETRDSQEVSKKGSKKYQRYRRPGQRNYHSGIREPFWNWKHVRLTDLILDENISGLEALFRSKGIKVIFSHAFDVDLVKSSKIPTDPKRYRGLKFGEKYEEYKRTKYHQRSKRSVSDYSERSKLSEDCRDDLYMNPMHQQPLALYAAYYGSYKVYEWLESDGPEIALREYQRKLEEKVKLDDNNVISEHIDYSDSDSSRALSCDTELSDEDAKRRKSLYQTKQIRKRKTHTFFIMIQGFSLGSERSFEERVNHLQNNITYFISKAGPSILESTENQRKLTPLLLAGSITNKCAMQALFNLGANIYATTDHTGHKENLLHMILSPHKIAACEDKQADTVEDCIDILPEGFLDWAIQQDAPLCAVLNRVQDSSPQSPFVQAGIKAVVDRLKDKIMGIRSAFAELPIHPAARNCTPEEHQLILDASSPDLIISEESNGMTPLDFAEEMRYKAILLETEKCLPCFYEHSKREHFRKFKPSEPEEDRFRRYGGEEEKPVLELRHEEWGTEPSEAKSFQHWKMASLAEQRAVKEVGKKRNLVTLELVNEATKESGKTLGVKEKGKRAVDIVSTWFSPRSSSRYGYY